jgi:Lsr2
VAQKVQVILVDDIDGGSAVETVGFSLDGVSYEIDLSSKNAAKLRDAFAGYVGSARRVGGRSGRRGAAPKRSSAAPNRTAEIRAWAKSNKVKVSERGRISADVVAKYEAANK